MLPEGLSLLQPHVAQPHAYPAPLQKKEKEKKKNGIRGFEFRASQRLERRDYADFICVTSSECVVWLYCNVHENN